MQQLGIWNIANNSPYRLQRTGINLEKELEDWIEQDPSLIQSSLLIVGRQLNLEAGILDLLGIDPVGNWTIIEIKRGNVRRETVAQALDYAACIQELPTAELKRKVHEYFKRKRINSTLDELLKERGIEKDEPDERNLKIFVVGTGRDVDLERVTKFLTRSGHSMSVVNFEVFEDKYGKKVILRELTEIDVNPPKQEGKSKSKPVNTTSGVAQKISVDSLCQMADKNGIGKQFRAVLAAAIKHNLYPRTYKHSIMYTPQSNKTRCLFCTWVKPEKDATMRIWVMSDAFGEFYPISDQEVSERIGENGYYAFDTQWGEIFSERLDELFAIIHTNEK